MEATITYERDEFCRYLEGTLVPDLEEDGCYETADDFRSCVELIRKAKLSRDCKAHARFLRLTLIPDLIESGKTYTAKDFQMAVEFMLNPETKTLSMTL